MPWSAVTATSCSTCTASRNRSKAQEAPASGESLWYVWQRGRVVKRAPASGGCLWYVWQRPARGGSRGGWVGPARGAVRTGSLKGPPPCLARPQGTGLLVVSQYRRAGVVGGASLRRGSVRRERSSSLFLPLYLRRGSVESFISYSPHRSPFTRCDGSSCGCVAAAVGRPRMETMLPSRERHGISRMKLSVRPE